MRELASKKYDSLIGIPRQKLSTMGLEIVKHILALFAVIIFAFPLYWMAISSLKPTTEIFNYPPVLFTFDLTLENYHRLITETRFLTWLRNSIVVTVGNIVLSVSLSTFAGYSFTRFDVYQKKNIARAFIFAYMFPGLMLALPYYMIFSFTGLLDTHLGLILAHAAVTLPFTTWIMWQFFQTIPIAWEESAWTMGAPRHRTMIEIALPGALPGIMASIIFALGISWNDFTFALILLSSPDQQIITTGLTIFESANEVQWDLLMTSLTLLCLPPFLIVLLLNKYILAGFNISGFD